MLFALLAWLLLHLLAALAFASISEWARTTRGGLPICQKQDPQPQEYLLCLECSHLAACSDRLPSKGLPSQLGHASVPDKLLREFVPELILAWLSHLLLGFVLLGYDGAPAHQIFSPIF